jgi:hypothetical protein
VLGGLGQLHHRPDRGPRRQAREHHRERDPGQRQQPEGPAQRPERRVDLAQRARDEDAKVVRTAADEHAHAVALDLAVGDERGALALRDLLQLALVSERRRRMPVAGDRRPVGEARDAHQRRRLAVEQHRVRLAAGTRGLARFAARGHRGRQRGDRRLAAQRVVEPVAERVTDDPVGQSAPEHDRHGDRGAAGQRQPAPEAHCCSRRT